MRTNSAAARRPRLNRAIFWLLNNLIPHAVRDERLSRTGTGRTGRRARPNPNLGQPAQNLREREWHFAFACGQPACTATAARRHRRAGAFPLIGHAPPRGSHASCCWRSHMGKTTRRSGWRTSSSSRSLLGERGHPDIPIDHPLGKWLASTRASIRRGTLDDGRVAEFRAAGGLVHPMEGRWDDAHVLLTEFVRREGHADVPPAHREKGVPLAAWLRQTKKRSPGGVDGT